MWTEALFVLLVLTDLMLLDSSLLSFSIRIVAAQGIALGALPLLTMEPGQLSRALFLAALTISLKGGVFPWLLTRTLRGANVRREMEPLVGYPLSLVLGVAALAFSFWLGSRIGDLGRGLAPLSIPAAFFTIFVGLFLIVARRKALTQVLGFVVLENGIYSFGLMLVGHIHWLVELGVLLDVFVAVFIMGIAIYHISREFDHMDVDQLDRLRG